jgi:GPI mannosyltransferase 3
MQIITKTKLLNLHQIFILISFILHLFLPYTNIGYYSMDEHFQILEPLAYKLELRNQINDIWEFEASIRPWIQIYFYYYIVLILIKLSITDPFIWIYAIQLVVSIIGFISTYLIYKLCLSQKIITQNNYNSYFFFLSIFILFIHIRTSSENLSISIFIFGIYFIFNFLKDEKNKMHSLILSAVFFGLSILIRFQMMFLVLPFYLWLLTFRSSKFIPFISFTIISLLLLIGLFVDYFGYGFFNNTYYKYYYYNIVLGIFDNFGVKSWWFYFSNLIINFFPPIGLFILLGLFLFILKLPKSFISWIVIFNLVLFSYLGHKEIRFIFPILIFSPIFLIFFFNFLEDKNFYKLSKYLKITIIIFNLIFITLLLFPAERQIHLYRYIYYNLNNNDIFYLKENPYIIDGLEPKFYVQSLIDIKEVNINDLDNFINTNTNINIITNRYEYFDDIINGHNSCKKIFTTYPEKLMLLNKNWKKRNMNWFIINCA